jgi:hypothetical protein
MTAFARLMGCKRGAACGGRAARQGSAAFELGEQLLGAEPAPAPRSAGGRSSRPTRRWRAARDRAQLSGTRGAPPSGCRSASPRRAADPARAGTSRDQRPRTRRAPASAGRPRGSRERARPRATSWWGLRRGGRGHHRDGSDERERVGEWRSITNHGAPRGGRGTRWVSPASPPATCRSHPCPSPVRVGAGGTGGAGGCSQP